MYHGLFLWWISFWFVLLCTGYIYIYIPDIAYGLFVPELSYHSFAPAVGIIGSIILPQNFFIHRYSVVHWFFHCVWFHLAFKIHVIHAALCKFALIHNLLYSHNMCSSLSYLASGLVLRRPIDRTSNTKVDLLNYIVLCILPFDCIILFNIQMHEANKYMLIDTAMALMVAFLINLAVISCFAEIFYSPGEHFLALFWRVWTSTKFELRESLCGLLV